MTISIALMGGATLALGLLPTYAQIGVAAPLLLVTLRLIQGFSLGGEFTGSMVYTTELASPRERGFISSSTAAGVTIGFILGSLAAVARHAVHGAGARRVVGLAHSVHRERRSSSRSAGSCAAASHETQEGEKAASIRPPLFPSLVADWRPMVQTFGIIATTNAAHYITFHVCGGAAQESVGGGGVGRRLDLPAREHADAVHRAVREAVRRLALRSHGPPHG